MAKLHQFVRGVSAGDLRHHLKQIGISLPPNLNWDAPQEEFSGGFLKAVDDLADQDRTQLLADIDRICDMTDEVGQAALMALAGWRDHLATIEGAHRRAHWLYVQSREAFRQAEEIRFADENQNAQRLWDGFIGPRLVDLTLGFEDIERFKATLRNILDAGRVDVEIFGRVRSRSGEPDRDLKQITVYSEDVPIDEVVFAAVGVKNQPRKPVRETAITYEPASGTIEVVGRVKALREKVAASFAKELLGVQLSGERLPPRRIDLTPLLEPHDLGTDPKDGVHRVKLTALTVSNFSGTLAQSFRVPFEDRTSLHEALVDQHGTANPLSGQVRPWMARIEVQFEPEAGAKCGKKINVDLCTPRKCNLRGKTEKERLILNRYLKAWGLLLGPAP